MNCSEQCASYLLTNGLKVLLLLLLVSVLISCTSTDRVMLGKAIKAGDLTVFTSQKAAQYASNPNRLIEDIKSIKQLLNDLNGKAGDKWGKEQTDLPSKDRYVKYTDSYESKAIIDFSAGSVTVATIAREAERAKLHKAIVAVLLCTDNPAATDIFSDQQPRFDGKPFLYGQVVDEDGKAIRYQWRAQRFADFLLANHLQINATQKGNRYSVTFPLVRNHNELRQQQYAEYVLSSAARYQVSPSLIYAIIQTESSFNPFAVSSANAYGLMQIVPATAGKDVYQRIKKQSGQPTRGLLFQPEYNIDIGAAYLHILDDVYLQQIIHPQSREYTMISAYNGGAGNVFKTFGGNSQQASKVINQLSAKDVYQRLANHHPFSETRRYIQKVLAFQKHYK